MRPARYVDDFRFVLGFAARFKCETIRALAAPRKLTVWVTSTPEVREEFSEFLQANFPRTSVLVMPEEASP